MEIFLGFFIGLIFTLILCLFLIKYIFKNQENKFHVLASEILEKNSNQLKISAEQNLSSVVAPLNDKIKEYKELMQLLQRSDLQDRESLREKLGQMIDSAQRIELEAGQLTRALSSDVKFQGQWGEIVLERILELAGLEKGREYTTQAHFKDEEKTYKPDVIINLPGETQIIIDSKVSLKAYFDYLNNEDKVSSLKNLKTSVSTHIDSLSKKNYHALEGVTSPEFVFLFVPVEGVYSLIIKEFPEIIEDSLRKNIILVSPINLMANLKTVSSLWRVEKQSKGAEEIAKKAGAMYDKFASLIEDLEKLGSSLNKSQSLYEDVQRKIQTGKGSLLTRAQELKEHGAKTTKTLN